MAFHLFGYSLLFSDLLSHMTIFQQTTHLSLYVLQPIFIQHQLVVKIFHLIGHFFFVIGNSVNQLLTLIGYSLNLKAEFLSGQYIKLR